MEESRLNLSARRQEIIKKKKKLERFENEGQRVKVKAQNELGHLQEIGEEYKEWVAGQT